MEINDSDTVEAIEGATQNMTVDELEAFVEAQKEALEKVRSSREVTAEKAEQARQAKADEEARRAEALAEVEKLCAQLEELEPGAHDDCMKSAQEN